MDDGTALTLLTTLVAALAGASILELLKVPAGALVGAMAGVAAVKLGLGSVTQLSPSVKFAAFVLLGWLIGESMDRSVLAVLGRAALPMVLTVVVLLVIGGGLAALLARLGVVDGTTAFLATSPGGLSQMAALGASVEANVPLVMGVHLLRITSVLVLAPIVVKWLD